MTNMEPENKTDALDEAPVKHENSIAHLGLYRKLHAIMSEVDYIQKDKTNTFFNYRYASEAAIKARLHESLVKHGVLFFPVNIEIRNRTDYTSDKGKRSSLTDVRLTYRFIDIETGESQIGTCEGTGDDGADKGTYKAITGALKYALTSTFLIETGDDPEDDEQDKVAPRAQKPSTRANSAPSSTVNKTLRDTAVRFKGLLEKSISKDELELVSAQIKQAVEDSAVNTYERGVLSSVYKAAMERLAEAKGEPFV